MPGAVCAKQESSSRSGTEQSVELQQILSRGYTAGELHKYRSGAEDSKQWSYHRSSAEGTKQGSYSRSGAEDSKQWNYHRSTAEGTKQGSYSRSRAEDTKQLSCNSRPGAKDTKQGRYNRSSSARVFKNEDLLFGALGFCDASSRFISLFLGQKYTPRGPFHIQFWFLECKFLVGHFEIFNL